MTVFLIFAGIGVATILRVIWINWKREKDLKHWSRATGTVVDFDITHSFNRRHRIYHPHVAFLINRNEEVTVVSRNHFTHFNFCRLEIGDRVEVFYDPEYPERAGLVSDPTFKAWTVGSLFFGISLINAGIGMMTYLK